MQAIKKAWKGEWPDRESMDNGQRELDKILESTENWINNKDKTAKTIFYYATNSQNKYHIDIEWKLENLNSHQEQKLILIINSWKQ